MDINKALTYPMDDDRWITKLLIGVLLMILSSFIIPTFFVYGYMIQIIRNVMDDVENPLPEWDDWGKLFKDGFNLFVAGLVYTLPIWLLTCCSVFAIVLPAMSEGGDAAAILAGIGSLAIIVISCLIIIFAIALMLIGPAISIQYAREDNLSACFKFSEIIGIARDNVGDIVIAIIVLVMISFLFFFVNIVPVIGSLIWLATNAYVLFIAAHLYGQIGIKAGGAPKEKEFDPIV